jgi:hypothetical protein
MNSRRFWKTLGGLAILVPAVFLLSITSQAGDRDNDRDDRYDNDRNSNNANQDEKLKIRIGQRIAPVPLNLKRKDDDTVYLGSYLVNTGGCNDCHTNPSFATGGNPFMGQPKVINKAGYLGGGQQFGPFTSRNLTPDVNGKPAGMSLSLFIQVMRTGLDPDHVHGPNVPLQVMPWPALQDITDRDLTAMYTYLSAIPCLEGDPGVNSNPPLRCR